MLRKIVTTVAAASGLLVLPALPGQAAPSGGCPYPPNRPVLSLTGTPSTVVASQDETVFGKFSRNGCGIGHASIALQRRLLVNGKPSGAWSTYETVTTNGKGTFSTTFRPARNQQQRAVFTKSGAYPSTTSNTITETVRDRSTADIQNTAPCVVTVTGTTYPVKAHRTIKIQSRGPAGHFNGWTTLWSATTNGKGRYSTTHKLTCGKTYNIATWVGPDSVDAGTRSATTYGVKPFRHANGF